MPVRLLANLGAEEGDAWRRMASHPRVRAVARLWAALFPASTRSVDPKTTPAPRLAPALARTADETALELCPSGDVLVPWLATPEAEQLAARARVPLAASSAAVVRRVHDKAFAHAAALAADLAGVDLADAVLVLEPDELRDADAARCRIESALARWPAELRLRFTVKPRLGTSGRGRCAGSDGKLDAARLRTALPRLRAAGGALVEPWLERTLDLSTQLHVASASDIRVLGTLRQLVTASGAPLGHAGRIDAEGRVDSATRWDAELRAAALTVAGAAAREGFRGPCGVDAFVYRASDGSERLRPVVELNARFTAGTVALGHLARARSAGLARDARAFYFGPCPYQDRWQGEDDAHTRIALLEDDANTRLCLAPSERELDAGLQSLR